MGHKGLGIYYLLSAFIFEISGTLISVLIRVELYSSGNRIISPENQNFYNISITLHGFLMIFFLVMPALFGGFGNYFVPIFQGSPEVVYPRVNNFQPNFWNSTKNNLWDPINDLCHELYFSSWNSSLGTSYVVAHFHFVLSLGAVIAIFSGVIFNLIKIVGISGSKNLLPSSSCTLSLLHLVSTFIGILLTFSPMHFLGFNVMPRRIPEFPM